MLNNLEGNLLPPVKALIKENKGILFVHNDKFQNMIETILNE